MAYFLNRQTQRTKFKDSCAKGPFDGSRKDIDAAID
jgi:hypothetical protein